jgi:hypothetical protein
MVMLIKAYIGLWDESKHPRHKKGDSRGGEFAPKGGSGEAREADTEKMLDKIHGALGHDWEVSSARGIAALEKRNQVTFRRRNTTPLGAAEHADVARSLLVKYGFVRQPSTVTDPSPSATFSTSEYIHRALGIHATVQHEVRRRNDGTSEAYAQVVLKRVAASRPGKTRDVKGHEL